MTCGVYFAYVVTLFHNHHTDVAFFDANEYNYVSNQRFSVLNI